MDLHWRRLCAIGILIISARFCMSADDEVVKEKDLDSDLFPGWLGASYVIQQSKNFQGDGGVDHSRVEQLSWKPRAFLYHGFLSDEEADHIVQLATPKLQRSTVVGDQDGGSAVSNVRTSFGMFISKDEDEIIKRIEKRISHWTFLPHANQEALQVLRYTRGQKYEPHHDFFPGPGEGHRGGHRYATVLMYLNDVKKGGETVFQAVDDPTPKDDSWSDCAKGKLAVKARKGDALLFYSMHPDGTPDEYSLHYACPVVEGVKWSAPKWIHVASFDDPPELAEAQDPKKCINTNALCEPWAAAGECAKNPSYMVGEGSFIGACRKACKACTP
eukprot:TRINITY_DN1766_c0_g1_i1.p1 TRINITY_DN1766_c0_g1~~TRINITY_DN1766_c0_g1_i1.p1  ORF type:complete len:330 (+),score=72.97 TRINITY_DN1766_c0_g1_i1:57-1046(+)